MQKLLFLLIPALLTVALAGCSQDEEVVGTTAPASGTQTASASATPTGTAPASGTPTSTATAVPSPTPSGTLTYTDAAYGYSFDYPAGWVLRPPQSKGGDAILYSYDPATGGPGPVPPDKLKAFSWVAQGVDKPLQDWLYEQDHSPGEISPPTVLSETDVTLGARYALRRVTESQGDQSISYYVPLAGNQIFVINANAPNQDVWAQFELVLNSLQFPS